MQRRLLATLREWGVTPTAPSFWAFRIEGAEAEMGVWCPVADNVVANNVGGGQVRVDTFPAARYAVLQSVPLADLWAELEGMVRWADQRSLPWDLCLAHTGSEGLDVPPESSTVDLNLRLRPPRPRLMTRLTMRYQPVQFSFSPLTDGWEAFVDTVGRVRAMVIERGLAIEGGAFWSFTRLGREAEFAGGREVAFTLCMPLRDEAAAGEVREQASGTYATVTHQGPPDQLELLVDWAAAQGLRWDEGIAVLQSEAEWEQDQSKWRVELAIRTLGSHPSRRLTRGPGGVPVRWRGGRGGGARRPSRCSRATGTPPARRPAARDPAAGHAVRRQPRRLVPTAQAGGRRVQGC